MDAFRIAIKFYIEHPQTIDKERFVPMFHLWIRDQGLSGHLLIDVADYKHVANGPGVVLVAHEANISLDETDGRLGLLYQRKRPFGHAFADRFATVLNATMEACLKLEHDPALGGHIKFRTDEFVVRIQDRLLAPNNAETIAKVRADIEKTVQKHWSQPAVSIEQSKDPNAAFEIRVRTSANKSVADLVDKTPAPVA
jgi:hypothetical protein